MNTRAHCAAMATPTPPPVRSGPDRLVEYIRVPSGAPGYPPGVHPAYGGRSPASSPAGRARPLSGLRRGRAAAGPGQGDRPGPPRFQIDKATLTPRTRRSWRSSRSSPGRAPRSPRMHRPIRHSMTRPASHVMEVVLLARLAGLTGRERRGFGSADPGLRRSSRPCENRATSTR